MGRVAVRVEVLDDWTFLLSKMSAGDSRRCKRASIDLQKCGVAYLELVLELCHAHGCDARSLRVALLCRMAVSMDANKQTCCRHCERRSISSTYRRHCECGVVEILDLWCEVEVMD